jgi:hypothetical protein
MIICRLTPAEVLASLDTSPAGLGEAEAARRAVEYGPNRVRRSPSRSASRSSRSGS